MQYETIDVRPIAGALGAEVRGVNLARPLANRTFAEIHQALLDHAVIVFREQDLSVEQYMDFGRRFGPLIQYAFSKGLPDHPEVLEIVKEPHETRNFGGGWHSDGTWYEKPPMGTMLYAREVPPAGGDTLFASGTRAYEALSDGMKALLDGLIAINSAALKKQGGRAQRHKEHRGMSLTALETADSYVAAHPIVRTHPETGRKSLYVNQGHTVGIKGMTEEESAPLLKFLFDHSVRPEFTCRLRWEQGSIALWDNRCTQHLAINDYTGHRRRMLRLTIAGDRPM